MSKIIKFDIGDLVVIKDKGFDTDKELAVVVGVEENRGYIHYEVMTGKYNIWTGENFRYKYLAESLDRYNGKTVIYGGIKFPAPISSFQEMENMKEVVIVDSEEVYPAYSFDDYCWSYNASTTELVGGIVLPETFGEIRQAAAKLLQRIDSRTLQATLLGAQMQKRAIQAQFKIDMEKMEVEREQG